jgi:hypothetical protein
VYRKTEMMSTTYLFYHATNRRGFNRYHYILYSIALIQHWDYHRLMYFQVRTIITQIIRYFLFSGDGNQLFK